MDTALCGGNSVPALNVLRRRIWISLILQRKVEKSQLLIAFLSVLIMGGGFAYLPSIEAHPAVQNATPRIYWTEYDYPEVTGKLSSATLEGSQVESLFELYYGRIVGVAVDPDADAVYFSVNGARGSDDSKGEIWRSDLDGLNDEVLISLTWISVEEIALDIAGGKMYFTTYEEYVGGTNETEIQVRRANLDGSQVETLASGRNRLKFHGITVDPNAGKIYWVRSNKIQRADLDGSNLETLLADENPYQLTIDPAGGKIYWTGGGSIHRANLNASAVETLARDVGTIQGIEVDVAAGHIYWANYSEGSIQRSNLDGTMLETVVSGLLEPSGIALHATALPTTTPAGAVTVTNLPGTSAVPNQEVPIGEPTVNFHASHTEVTTGEPVALTLSVANSIINPEMTLQLVLQLPSGLSITGAGLSESCSVQCAAIYKVPTGENRDFLLTAVSNQAGSFTVAGRMEWYFGDNRDTHSGKLTSLALIAVNPVATPTPIPSIVGEPTVNLHATQTEVGVGQPVILTLVADNSIAKPDMTLKFILPVPSGWSMSGTGFSESCSGQCTATYQVAPGDQKSITLEMLPNQPGSFSADALMEWFFGTDVSTLERKSTSLQLTVATQHPREDARSTGWADLPQGIPPTPQIIYQPVLQQTDSDTSTDFWVGLMAVAVVIAIGVFVIRRLFFR